jgi:2Fe-2S iron-sulfur cluster binding domain
MAMVLRVFRWSPEAPRERFQAFPVETGATTTVLDALVEIQRAHDPTLAFRYACRVGMCGSCGMVVNGRETWACRLRLARLGGDVVTVRPLYHFPLVRDLVVDMTRFVEKMRAVGAVFRTAGGSPNRHLAWTPTHQRVSASAPRAVPPLRRPALRPHYLGVSRPRRFSPTGQRSTRPSSASAAARACPPAQSCAGIRSSPAPPL